MYSIINKKEILDFKIVGIKNSSENERLKRNLQVALSYYVLDYTIKEITKVDEIIKEGVQSIPALVVNDFILWQNSVPSVKQISHSIKSYMEDRDHQFILRKILVPTDFSSCSQNAYWYARELAYYFDSKLKVVNCFHTGMDSSNALFAISENELRQKTESKLKKFVTTRDDALSGQLAYIQTDIEALPGFAAEEIPRLSSAPDIDAVAMSACGEHNILEKIFGNISVSVAKNSSIPVFLIPNKAVFKPYKKILYASSYDSAEEQIVKKLFFFSKPFGADLHFVNIKQSQKNGWKKAESKLRILAEKLNGQTNPVFLQINSDSIVNGLNNYARENDIDLIVLATKHRSLLEDFFHKSITRKFALNPQTPILVLHKPTA